MAPPASDQRLGPTRRVPESALRIAVPDGRMAAGLQLGAGKGLEFNVGDERGQTSGVNGLASIDMYCLVLACMVMCI